MLYHYELKGGQFDLIRHPDWEGGMQMLWRLASVSLRGMDCSYLHLP